MADSSMPKRPRVGVIGEIYIRNNRFSNNNLVEKLEAVGLEVELASFSEWIYFTTEMFKRDSHRKGSLKDIVNATLKDHFQHRDERAVVRRVFDELDGHFERPVGETLKFIEPYLPISVGGEAMPAMGKALEMMHKGCSGIVNTLPFTSSPRSRPGSCARMAISPGSIWLTRESAARTTRSSWERSPKASNPGPP